MIHLLHHLFDTRGFPTVATYGRSWEPWLVWLFAWSRAIAAVAYILLLVGFLSADKADSEGRIDIEAARVHARRVRRFYEVSCALNLVLYLSTIVALWFPAMRALGLLTFVSSLALFAAAVKTCWAVTMSTTFKGQS